MDRRWRLLSACGPLIPRCSAKAADRGAGLTLRGLIGVVFEEAVLLGLVLIDARLGMEPPGTAF